MADNILVPWSGQRIFTSAGVLAGGALIYLYAEDTTDLLTVYSDRDLLVTQANPITCDANGLAPMMFLGTTAYKIKITTSAGVTIDEEDDLPGALNTTPFSAATFAKADSDVTSKTSDYTLVEADLGGTFNGTCTGGTVQFTLLSAVMATNGRGFTIRHNGTANYVKIVSVSSQTISRPATGVTTTGFALVGYGESITLVSDGANWHVGAYVPPLITAATGIIAIRDRITAAPVSPNPGDRYIVTASYSTFETHDIIEYDGQGNYIEYTPAADCGWIAYVQDEDIYYFFRASAWVAETATSTQQGTVKISTEALMETGTATDTAVLIGHQHRHPGHPKASLLYNQITPAINRDYGVTSVSDDDLGDFTVTFDTAFSAADYACPGLSGDAGGVVAICLMGTNVAFTTTTRSFKQFEPSVADRDEVANISVFGDQ